MRRRGFVRLSVMICAVFGFVAIFSSIASTIKFIVTVGGQNESQMKRSTFRLDDVLPETLFCGRKVRYDVDVQVGKKFVFIGGNHFSGTSLINVLFQNDKDDMFRVFDDSCKEENEGQKLQTVFSSARVFGGPCTYAIDRDVLRMSTFRGRLRRGRSASLSKLEGYSDCKDTEISHRNGVPLCHYVRHVARFPFSEWMGGPRKQRLLESDVRSDDRLLLHQWWTWWSSPGEQHRDADSARIYVEKSPNHILNSRWMQRVFSPYGKSLFIFTLRHPLSIFKKHCNDKVSVALYLENWLNQVETLREDIVHLDGAVVLRYEDFVRDGEEAAMSRFESLKQFVFDFHDVESSPPRSRLGRRLMYFNGNRTKVKIEARIPQINPVLDERIYLAYEDRLNVFGYSLRGPSFVRQIAEKDTYPFAPWSSVVL